MEFLKTIAEIITSLSVIIGALLAIEKFTKGKLTQWLVKPVVEPINQRIDILEQKSNKRGKNVTTLKQEVERFRKDSKEDMKMHVMEYDKTYLTDFLSELEQGQAQTNAINELLSTTKTSAILLDNLQSDLESEVM